MLNFKNFFVKLITIFLICQPAFSSTSIEIKDFENSKTKILFVGFESDNFIVNNEGQANFK